MSVWSKGRRLGRVTGKAAVPDAARLAFSHRQKADPQRSGGDRLKAASKRVHGLMPGMFLCLVDVWPLI